MTMLAGLQEVLSENGRKECHVGCALYIALLQLEGIMQQLPP